MSETLILSIGSELRGDDGVGKAVIDAIQGSGNLPVGVSTMECGMSDLSGVLESQDVGKAILVDAANMGLCPGEWRRFDLNQTDCDIFENNVQSNPHGLSLSEAITLGLIFGTLPDQIVIYGVQPQFLGYCRGLSDPVRNAVTEVCKAIQIELETPAQETDFAPTCTLKTCL